MAPDFERLARVLRREQPDHVPNYEHIIDPAVMTAITGKPPPAIVPGNAPSKIAHARYTCQFFKAMGYDYVPMEMPLRLFRLNVIVSSRPGPRGTESRGWVDDNRSTIASSEEFDEYPWPGVEDAIDYEYLVLAAKVLPEGMKLVSGVAGGVHEHVMWLTGMRAFSRALRRDPAFVDAMFGKVGSLIAGVDAIIAELDHVGAMRMGDDMGYKSATMLSPATLRKHVFPRQKQVVQVAHRHDKPFILHSCGNLTEIIDELIGDVCIDAWHSFQDVILPVTEAKRLHGDRVAILGGIDLDRLCRGTPAAVRQHCQRVLAACMPGGGYALGSGNSIPTYVNLDNYRAMLDAGKAFGAYR